ncbi:unnamed protein product [Ceutorhynchus assimilis]|uniref:Trichohyalin-plectin-homology domain-containing protein n=1 Tax=Ceutorhynchus assimilis TaxID=467358 RepID=A0A9N9MQB9_9CUCU|nr:unnamed protein product [Ceutorhynchus assimilis]
MESTWYLFPGQTLENTKISDRARALHMTQSSLDEIKSHINRQKLLQEVVDREAAVKKYLKDGSRNMTESWPNSLENVRKRKEKERLELIEQRKEERERRFFQLRKEQEEIRKAYMEKVKKQIYMTTGHARDLTSALLTSEVLFERQKQQEFQEKIKIHEIEEEKIYAETQKKLAEEEAVAKEEKKQKILEKEKKHFEELKIIVAEKNTAKKAAKEEKIKKEALDNIEAVKEEEIFKKIILEDKLQRKKQLFEERKTYLREQKEREAQTLKEQKELDEVIQIYTDTKHNIDCMRKAREKELRDNAVKLREKIAAMVMAEEMDKSAAEELILKKAIKEKEAAEIEKNKAKQEYDKKMKEEIIKNREEVLAREEERKQKENEIKKWELLNRFKTDQYMKIYEDQKKRKLWHDIIKYRQELCEQIEENKIQAITEKMIDDALSRTSVKGDDAKFFKYANEVLEMAKRKKRNTKPIERVITKYIKETNVDPNEFIDGDKDSFKTLDNLISKKSQRKSRPCKCVYAKKS